MAGFQLPGWRRAAALAMAAGALRRVDAHRRAADLTDQALDVAQLEEDLELAQRVRHARQCAIAAKHLGNLPEAGLQADLAESSAVRTRPDMYRRGEIFEALLDVAGQLGEPERVDRIMGFARQGDNREMLLRATVEAGLVLARHGRCESAQGYIARALEDLAAVETATTAAIHSGAACAWHLCGNPDRAAEHLTAALKIACTDRELVADVLNDNLEFLTAIDGGASPSFAVEGVGDR
jgi:hypothetical protein